MVGRINHTFFFDFAYLRRRLALGFGPQFFEVRDGLFKNAAQNRDGNFIAKVPMFEVGNRRGKVIGKLEGVYLRVRRKQAAIIGPDVEWMTTAHIDSLKQVFEIIPERDGFYRGNLGGGSLQKPGRQQPGATTKSHKQNPVQQFLHRLDGQATVQIWAIRRSGDIGQNVITQSLVLFIQIIGDSFECIVGCQQQRFGFPAEQLLRVEQHIEPPQFVRVIKPLEIEHLITIAATAKTIETDFNAV